MHLRILPLLRFSSYVCSFSPNFSAPFCSFFFSWSPPDPLSSLHSSLFVPCFCSSFYSPYSSSTSSSYSYFFFSCSFSCSSFFNLLLLLLVFLLLQVLLLLPSPDPLPWLSVERTLIHHCWSQCLMHSETGRPLLGQSDCWPLAADPGSNMYVRMHYAVSIHA